MATYHDEKGHFTNKENDGGPCKHKRINKGNYEYSEDGGKSWNAFNSRKEYDEYQADEDERFDENVEDDFGEFDNNDRTDVEKYNSLYDAIEGADGDRLENEIQYAVQEAFEKGEISESQYNELFDKMDEKMLDEEPNPMNEFSGPDREGPSYAEIESVFTPNDIKQIEKYAEHYGIDADILKQECLESAKELMEKGSSVTNAKNDAMEDVLDSVANATDREQFLKDMAKAQKAEVIGGDDDNEGLLKDKTPLSEEESKNLDPNNPKYKGMRRSSITNAKEVFDGGTVHNFDRDKDERWSIIEYIPYGALQDGDNRKLYGIVTDYDGSDAPDTGAIVGASLEDAKEQLERQKQLAEEGSERYLKRGKWDEDWFKMLSDDSYEWDEDTKNHYSQKYGWDFKKPWEEQEHIKSTDKKDTDNGDGTRGERGPGPHSVRDLKYEQDNPDYGQDKRPQKKVK